MAYMSDYRSGVQWFWVQRLTFRSFAPFGILEYWKNRLWGNVSIAD
jgi:hypothetical protein